MVFGDYVEAWGRLEDERVQSISNAEMAEDDGEMGDVGCRMDEEEGRREERVRITPRAAMKISAYAEAKWAFCVRGSEFLI